MSTRIGCDNLVYAKMTVEDTATTQPTYGDVVEAPGVMHVNINPNASQDTLFWDDGPGEAAATLGKIEVEIQKNELTTQNRSDLLGHLIDSKGALVYGGADVPPFVAIGFRSLKSSGKYKYVWLYKGKFSDFEEQNETKGDSINFQADTITGNFVKLSYGCTVEGTTINPWKYELDEEDEDADQTLLADWFNDVQFPSTTMP